MRANKLRRCAVQNPRQEDSDSEADDETLVRRDGSTIFFHCDVTTKSVLQLILAIDAAACHAFANDKAYITLCVHSYGGCAFAGLSAFDHIVNARMPVHTIATGFVASAATIICLAGARRFAHKHTCLLIHEISTEMEGKLNILMDEVENSKVTMKMLLSIYTERTNLTRSALKLMLKKETMLTFSKACQYGFVEGTPINARPHSQPIQVTSPVQLHAINSHIRWT